MAKEKAGGATSERRPAVHRAVMRPGRPSLHQTFQLSAHIHTEPARAASDFAAARKLCLQWLDQKWPERLPKAVMDGGNFEGDQHGQRLDVVALPESGHWAAKLQQPDMPFAGNAAVPGRTWITELCLSPGEQRIDFGVRVMCSSLEFADAPIALTRPRIVRDIAARLNLHGARVMDGKPWLLSGEPALDDLAALLTDRGRSLPVFLLTQPDPMRLRTNAKPWLLDADRLARETLGVAHVVQMPVELGWKWSERHGKPWGAYLGAVRVFFPGLDFERDSPYSHPLRMAEDVLFFRHDGKQGEEAYERFLLDKAFENASGRFVDWGSRKFVAELKNLRNERLREKLTLALETAEAAKSSKVTAKQANETVSKLKESLQLAATEIEELKRDRDEWRQMAEGFSDEVQTAGQNARELRHENARLRAMVGALRAQLEAKTGDAPDNAVPIPESFDEMGEWAEKYLLDRLVLHPRALRGIKKARYQDPQLAYRALLLLANEYRNMRLGIEGGKEQYECKRGELALRDGGSISDTKAGEQGDEYFIEYPSGTGHKQFLQFHLRKGASKDERHCLAIYYIWSEEDQVVVVGWLPSHLDNRMT